MKQAKARVYEDGAVSNTQVVYTKAPIQGSVDTVTNDQSIRLQFKASDMQLCDIANSTFNFTLNINQGNTEASSTNMLVPNESVLDLFEVQSVSWNGVRMNLQQLNYAGMLYRRVRSKCNGEQYRLTTGQHPQPENIDVSGLGDYVTTAVGNDGFTVAPGVATLGVFPNNDLRGLSRFCGATIGAANSRDPSAMIAEQERFRLITEGVKHYTRTASSILAPIYTKYQATNLTKMYSVKLGELIPELMNFQIVDKSLFAGSGLEIQLNLLNPLLCMQKFIIPPVSTITAADCGRHASDSYILSNMYCGMVFHKTLSPSLGLYSRVPFTSIYHTRSAITNNQINHQFSLNSGCIVRGVIVLYSPIQQLVAQRPKFNFGILGNIVPAHNVTSKAYFQNQQIGETVLQIGNQMYPGVQAPPTGDKNYWYYQLAQAYSEQVMGIAYSTSLERFLTIDFAQFIPVQRRVAQGELFQFYQSFATDVNSVDKECNILVLCERVIEFDKDGSVRVENL